MKKFLGDLSRRSQAFWDWLPEDAQALIGLAAVLFAAVGLAVAIFAALGGVVVSMALTISVAGALGEFWHLRLSETGVEIVAIGLLLLVGMSFWGVLILKRAAGDMKLAWLYFCRLPIPVTVILWGVEGLWLLAPFVSGWAVSANLVIALIIAGALNGWAERKLEKLQSRPPRAAA